jgi:hypothetical protein
VSGFWQIPATERLTKNRVINPLFHFIVYYFQLRIKML